MTDLYGVLGVPKDATKDQIKSAFRREAKKHHPDRNAGKPSEKFNQLSIAYTTLKDDAARDRYDATGEINDRGGDPIEENAKGLLGMIMAKLMERDDLLSIDMPKRLLKELREHRDSIKEGDIAVTKLTAKLARLKKAQVKLITPKKGAFLTQLLDAKIVVVERDVSRISAEVAEARLAVDRATEIVESGEYTYEPDPAPPASTAADPDILMADLIDRMFKSSRGSGKSPFSSGFGT